MPDEFWVVRCGVGWVAVWSTGFAGTFPTRAEAIGYIFRGRERVPSEYVACKGGGDDAQHYVYYSGRTVKS